ncbi:MAG TPA: hypothetical protein VKW08_18935 [Xanthobacteraceae bacterium]|jgi:hypothetical protein|nr:hypothetical protein [Xanthobacteraceae bacterium]
MSAKPIVMAAAIALGALTGSVCVAAAQGGGPPKIDIQRVCQAGASEIISVFGDTGQDVLGTCIQDEEMARDQLHQNWNDFPALAKQRCVQTGEYLPSYVEWQACLEMTRDVIKMRQDRNAAASAASNGYSDMECPIVKTDADGNIQWIDACPLGRRSRR